MSSRRARTFGSQALDSSKRGNSWRPRDWPDPISADKEGLVTRLLESIAEFKLGRPSSSSDFAFWPVWTSVTKNNGIDVCPPFFECPARFTGLLAYQALARCPCRPPSGLRARYPDFALCWGPPIALAISYGSSSSQPQGPALRGQSGLSRQPPFELC
ncbi:hypothetical protein ZIOFF_074285 (mitochondrion) [Zingiber officinale]|uniref:Uncharacterized protein n=1 Tax=Zingiber officinale TaxID=94328 RepID=A0A8J5BY00_ZINOF|nr:hypothetical protein ZIOFF_074804 [Zingiber officinale]KAG6467778.1 hypothetical protein ZIOFF_074285 [Zingiber officinale]